MYQGNLKYKIAGDLGEFLQWNHRLMRIMGWNCICERERYSKDDTYQYRIEDKYGRWIATVTGGIEGEYVFAHTLTTFLLLQFPVEEYNHTHFGRISIQLKGKKTLLRATAA